MKTFRRPSLIVLALFVTLLAPTVAADGDRDRAKSAADGFLRSFEAREFRSAYRQQASSSLRQRFGEEAFVAQASILSGQLGGPGSRRELIDETELTQMPMPDGSALRGSFYTFRYKARYPVGGVYETISTERESDGSWKIIGFYFHPAPE